MIKRIGLTRREFHRLTAAAMGGLMTGAVVGCSGADDHHADRIQPNGDQAGDGTPVAPVEQFDDRLLLTEPHVCRGLNACHGKYRGTDNACAGQSSCATAEAHQCAAKNSCEGQGGCGQSAGQNECRGKGQCAVPIDDAKWNKVRDKFAKAYLAQSKGRELGMAPSLDTRLLAERHICRGLNTCRGQGAGKDNECAGQGTCATVEAHACAGLNKCLGQGGCEGSAGRNACQGKGNCMVPLQNDTWKKVRDRFEEVFKANHNGRAAAPAP